MRRKTCPCCGAPYNGKRCQSCFYEPFTEEIAHGTHTHEEEPLVVSSPVKRESGSGGCAGYTGRRKPGIVKWLLVAMAVFLAVSLLPVVFEVISVVSTASREAFSSIPLSEEETAAPPVSDFAALLYDDGEIRITADWQPGDKYLDMTTVQVQNGSGRDICVSSELDCVNGIMTEYPFLYCPSCAGQTDISHLSISDVDMMNAGIETVSEISFRLLITDYNSYDLIGRSDWITLQADVGSDFVQSVDDSGDEIYNQDGVRVVYQGPDGADCRDGELRFLIENDTSEFVDVYSSGIRVNGQTAELYLYSDLCPNTVSYTSVYLYPLQEQGIETIADIQSMELILVICGPDGCDYELTDWISVPIAQTQN